MDGNRDRKIIVDNSQKIIDDLIILTGVISIFMFIVLFFITRQNNFNLYKMSINDIPILISVFIFASIFVVIMIINIIMFFKHKARHKLHFIYLAIIGILFIMFISLMLFALVTSLINKFTLTTDDDVIFNVDLSKPFSIGELSYYYFTIMSIITTSLFSLAIFWISKRNNELTKQLVAIEGVRENERTNIKKTNITSNAIELFYDLKITFDGVYDLAINIINKNVKDNSHIHIGEWSKNIGALQNLLVEEEYEILYNFHSDILKINKLIDDSMNTKNTQSLDSILEILKRYINPVLINYLPLITLYSTLQILNYDFIILMNHLCIIYSDNSLKFRDIAKIEIGVQSNNRIIAYNKTKNSSSEHKIYIFNYSDGQMIRHGQEINYSLYFFGNSQILKVFFLAKNICIF